MQSKAVVHVIGTGTIGEPLIGLLCDFQEKLGIDEVTFHGVVDAGAIEIIAIKNVRLDRFFQLYKATVLAKQESQRNLHICQGVVVIVFYESCGNVLRRKLKHFWNIR